VKHLIAALVARLVSAGAAIGAMTAGAGVVVVALSFTLYAVLRDYAHLSPAACSAIVAAVYGVLLLIGGLIFAAKAKGGKKKPAHHNPVQDHRRGEESFFSKLSGVARDRPAVAAGAAIAAGLLAWKNPRLVATVLRAFEVEPRRDY